MSNGFPLDIDVYFLMASTGSPTLKKYFKSVNMILEKLKGRGMPELQNVFPLFGGPLLGALLKDDQCDRSAYVGSLQRMHGLDSEEFVQFNDPFTCIELGEYSIYSRGDARAVIFDTTYGIEKPSESMFGVCWCPHAVNLFRCIDQVLLEINVDTTPVGEWDIGGTLRSSVPVTRLQFEEYIKGAPFIKFHGSSISVSFAFYQLCCASYSLHSLWGLQ